MSEVDILVADDEPYIIRALSFIFEREGFSFQTARDGEEALKKTYKLRPKIIFLDITMPKKNGFEVCSEIKSDPEIKGSYVAMFTAKGQEDDKRRAMLYGADEYITKPFSPVEIISKVKGLLTSL
ncbi:MAG: response regulator [Nitrospirota bacterium]